MSDWESANRRDAARERPPYSVPWRTGGQVGRTIYDGRGELIGLMDTIELAERVVRAVNAWREPEG